MLLTVLDLVTTKHRTPRSVQFELSDQQRPKYARLFSAARQEAPSHHSPRMPCRQATSPHIFFFGWVPLSSRRCSRLFRCLPRPINVSSQVNQANAVPLGIAWLTLAHRGSALMATTLMAIGIALVAGGWPRGRRSGE